MKDRDSVISDHFTAPRPSGESTIQGNLFTPASSVLELRHVSCAYETGRPAVQGISFAAREGEIGDEVVADRAVAAADQAAERDGEGRGDRDRAP